MASKKSTVSRIDIRSLLTVFLFLILPISLVVVFSNRFDLASRADLSIGADNSVTFPQYLVMRKDHFAQTSGNGGVDGLITNAVFDPQRLGFLTKETRRTYLERGIDEVINAVGTKGSDYRKLAIQMHFDLFRVKSQFQTQVLTDFLEVAYAKKMPVVISFDGRLFLDDRPDLWNWWDSTKPGYNANNINNVEWIGIPADNTFAAKSAVATKVSWRNWGTQMRVYHPAINLASPAIKAATKQAMDRLSPILAKYYQSLLPSEKYLFGGVVLGMEMENGVNSYYYPNGNTYLTKNPSDDPGICLKREISGNCIQWSQNQPAPDFYKNVNGGLPQLGYNAALTQKLISPQKPEITQEINDKIIQNYGNFLVSTIENSGIPLNKVYYHTGGTFGSNSANSTNAAAVFGANPGWSLYDKNADNPNNLLNSFFNSASRKELPWGGTEWLSFDSGSNWKQSLNSTANYFNNKLISVANWESGVIKAKNDNTQNNVKLKMINEFLSETNFCSLTPAILLGTANSSKGTTLNIGGIQKDTAIYVNISTSKARAENGTLKSVNVWNSLLDSNTLAINNSASGTAYLQLVTDGCNGKRVLSEIFPINITKYDQTITEREYPILFTQQFGNKVLFTWKLDPTTLGQPYGLYLNVSTKSDTNPDGTLVSINAVNANLTDKVDYSQTMNPGTYYGILAHDVAGKPRAVSSVFQFKVN